MATANQSFSIPMASGTIATAKCYSKDDGSRTEEYVVSSLMSLVEWTHLFAVEMLREGFTRRVTEEQDTLS